MAFEEINFNFANNRINLPTKLSEGINWAEIFNTIAPAEPKTEAKVDPELKIGSIPSTQTVVELKPRAETNKRILVSIDLDKQTEKPKLSLGQLITNTLTPVLPLPIGMTMNVISSTSEIITKDKALSKPLTQAWDNFKKQTGISNIVDFPQRIYRFMAQFNSSDNSVEQLKKQLEKEAQIQKQIVKADTDQREFQKAIERQQREREAQAKADTERALAERQTQEAQAQQAARAELTEKQREEQAKAIELASTTKASSISELAAPLKAMINTANSFGLSIDVNSLASNASADDVKRKIDMKILDDPSAGIAYLTSMGKNLNPVLDKMIRSTNSANISRVVLNQYLNSGSTDSTETAKTIDEYLLQQEQNSVMA